MSVTMSADRSRGARSRPALPFDIGAAGVAASFIHAIVAGLTAVTAVLTVQPEQQFADPIVGALALQGGRKGGDLIALPLGVAVAVLVGVAVAAAVRAQPGASRRDRLAAHLVWWACPGSIAVGALFAGVPLSGGLVALTLLAAALICAETFLTRRAGRVLAPRALSASVLGCLTWAVVPVALVVAVTRTTPEIAILLDRIPWPWPMLVAGAIACSVELHSASRGRESMRTARRRFVAVPACALPLLFLSLQPARLRLPDGTIDAYDSSGLLLVVCWALALFGVGTSVRHLRRLHSSSDGAGNTRLLPTAGVVALVVASMFGATRPPVVSSDDYHLGEMLLGWFRYRAGDLPFLDHQPAHGMVQDDVVAVLSSVFFDGSAAGQTEATRLGCALLAALVFVVVLWATRSQLLAVAVTFVGSSPIVSAAVPLSGMTWTFLVAAGWLLIAQPLRQRPQWWLTVWLFSLPVLVIAAPAQGLVMWLAATPLAIRSVAQVVAARDRRHLLPPVAAGLALAAVGVLTPLAAMMSAALRYVLSNATVNTAAYGIAWRPGFAGGGDTPFSFEVLRMLWVVGLVMCSLVALAELSARRWHSEVLARAVFLGLLISGVLPYVMGRLDIGGTSRAGLATAFVMALVVPALVWHGALPARRAMTAAGTLAAVSTLFGAFALPGNVVTAARPFADSPDLVDGAAVGLPGWGRAAPEDPIVLDQAVRLGRILDDELRPGAPYYDATSSNAQYYYLGRRPVVAVTAAYNTPLPADQRRTIRELRASRPQTAVLLQPNGNTEHDGGGSALRTPILTRFLEETYTPYQRDGFILGQWGTEIPASADQVVELALAESSDSAWDRGASRSSAAIRLDDPAAALFLREGTSLQMPDGSTRRVTARLPGGVVEVDRPVYADLVSAPTRNVTVEVGEVDRRLYRAWLFEKAFGRTYLEHLPESWGESSHEMEGVAPVSDVEGAGPLDVTAPVMQVSLPAGVEDRDVDFVSLDLRCEDAADDARVAQMEVSWESDRTFGDAPGRTFDISGSGPQLVPLDSSAYWRAGLGATILTIRILFSEGCTEVAVSDIALWSRKDAP